MSWLDEMLKKREEKIKKEKDEKDEKEKEAKKKIIDEYKKSEEFKKDVVEIVANEWHKNNDDRTDADQDENEEKDEELEKKAKKNTPPAKTLKDAEKLMKKKETKENGKK